MPLDKFDSPRLESTYRGAVYKHFWIKCILMALIFKLGVTYSGLSRNYRCNDSCKRGNAKPIAPEDMNSQLYSNSHCYCDSNCIKYGDCCPDFDNLHNVTHKDTDYYNKWECQQLFIQTSFRPTTAYVINSCPPKYDVQSIAKRCKKEVQEQEYDFTLDYQVLSKDTNITYSNVYCAECNNEILENLHKWEIDIYCIPPPHSNQTCDKENKIHLWQYVPKERMWTFNGFKIFYYIKDYIENYYKEYGARRCKEYIIQQCPDTWKDTRESLLCASHALHVMSSEEHLVYKNEYCAACYNRTKGLICPYAEAIPFLVGTPPPYLPEFLSFSRLLSFRKTKNNQLCNSLQTECKVYECGKNFKKDGSGQCVQKHHRYQQGGLNDSCAKVQVNENDFIRLNNGSIYVNITNQIYTPNEYENKSKSGVLICADENWVLRKYSRAQAILSTVCITLSLICLSAHIVVHILFSELRNLPGKMLLCLSGSIFVGQLCFELQGFFKSSIPLCQTIAVIMHYSFLSSFFWMNVMAADTCLTFTTRTSRATSNKQFMRYSLYAWLNPGIIVTLALLNDFFEYIPRIKPTYYNQLGTCWINNRWALLVFFVMPLGIILLENIIFFAITVLGIFKTNKIAKLAHSTSQVCDVNINLAFIYVKLAVVMGLTWIFGFIAMLLETEFLWYLFIIFNASQGAFIFVSFTCKRKVYRLLKTTCCKNNARPPGMNNLTPSSSHLTLSTPVSNIATASPSHNLNKRSELFYPA